MEADTRRIWVHAQRAWLLAVAILLAYANLVYSGVALMGLVPVVALAAPGFLAIFLTFRACLRDARAAGYTIDQDPLGLTCGTLVVAVCGGLALNGLLLGAGNTAFGAVCGVLLFVLGLAYLPLMVLVVTLPVWGLASLSDPRMLGRAVAALALHCALVAIVVFGPGAFVSSSAVSEAALDCTVECRTVANAIAKAGVVPIHLDEPYFKSLVERKLLKRVPVHRIDGEKQVPTYYMLRGHVVCTRHFWHRI